METWINWGWGLLQGVPFFLANPFTYILLVVIMLLWRRQVQMERKIFGNRLHSAGEGVLQSIWNGILGGLFASIILIGIGVVFSLEPFIYLWIVAIILSLFRLRFINFAYAGAVLAALVLIARLVSLDQFWSGMSHFLLTLQTIHLPSLFALVAGLHIAQTLLVYLKGHKRRTPIYVSSKRGRLIGGYHIQHMWFVPIFLLAESEHGVIDPLFLSWPLFTSSGVGALSLLLLPVTFYFSGRVISSTVRQKVDFSAAWMGIYSVILLGLSFVSLYVPAMIFIALVFSVAGYELLFWVNSWTEQKNAPKYVHTVQGVTILDTLPDTLAGEMAIEAGEVIAKVNGQAVTQGKDMYEALALNKAFCKLEIINNEGQIRFVNRSIYEDDHHLLGIILAPDETVPYYYMQKEQNLWRLIRQKMHKKRNGASIKFANEQRQTES